ncbi:MAG: hypothetical protein ABF331_04825, partial [Hellea sp.]
VSLSLSHKKKTTVESSAREGLLYKEVDVRNITNNHFLYGPVFLDTNIKQTPYLVSSNQYLVI